MTQQNKKYIKALFEPFFADKKSYLFHIFVSISFLFLGLFNIELIRKLIESVEKNLGFEITVKYGIFAIFLVLLIFIGRLFFSYLRPKYLNQIQRFLYNKYYNKFILLDNEKVNNYGTGKFISILGGIFAFGEILYIILFELGINIIAYILNIIMIGYININLVLPVILLTILLLISMNFISKKTFKYRDERKKLWEKEGGQKVKILMEKFTILKNGKAQEEINKVLELNKKIEFQGRKVTFFTRLLSDGSQAIVKIGEILLVLFIGYLIYKSEASYADMGALLFVMALVKKNIDELNIYYRQINNYSNDFTRLVDIFEEIPEIKNYETGKKYKYKNGEIKIKNLEYKYPDGKKVFDKLSLEIPAKSKVAFIGKSGSGKSTLVKLILGFIEKDAGEILIDNQELDELSKKSYYKHIGYLSQEPNVFDGTVLENIVYGSPHPLASSPLGGDGELTNNNSPIIPFIKGDKNIEKVIKLASCEFVYDLPEGLETKIGEKGVKLSGGERQRLAIARLFLQNPYIIILDEPTSALDSFSEDSISKALENLSLGKTMITIAHRLQTIKKSDLIFVFENGKIIEKGNHKELLKNSETYKKLVDLQSGEVLE